MMVIVTITVGILGLAMVLGMIRLFRAHDDASVAAVSDLMYFCAVAIIMMIMVYRNSSITFDVLSLAGLVGILATVALSRILTRGRR